MKVLLLEHACWVGSPPAPAGILAQGRAMLHAAHRDLALVDPKLGVEPIIAARPDSAPPGTRRLLTPPADLVDLPHPATPLQDAADDIDLALVIAPETDPRGPRPGAWGLWHWLDCFEKLGVDTLNTPARLARLLGDKAALPRWLHRRDPAAGDRLTPPARRRVAGVAGAWVLKPRFGAGCEATRRVESMPIDPGSGEIAQPWVPGEPVSIAGLFTSTGVTWTPALRQRIIRQGDTLGYAGGAALPEPGLQQRSRAIARRTATLLPGLRGWVGFDLVLGATPEGDRLIEVNPRLTIGFVVLATLAHRRGVSLLQPLLDIAAPPPAAWAPKTPADLRFDATGHATQPAEEAAR